MTMNGQIMYMYKYMYKYKRCSCLNDFINGKDIDLYLEYGYSTILEKNEATTMFFLKEPSLDYKVYFVKVYFVIGIYGC